METAPLQAHISVQPLQCVPLVKCVGRCVFFCVVRCVVRRAVNEQYLAIDSTEARRDDIRLGCIGSSVASPWPAITVRKSWPPISARSGRCVISVGSGGCTEPMESTEPLRALLNKRCDDSVPTSELLRISSRRGGGTHLRSRRSSFSLSLGSLDGGPPSPSAATSPSSVECALLSNRLTSDAVSWSCCFSRWISSRRSDSRSSLSSLSRI